MKKLLFLALIIWSCNSEKDESKKDSVQNLLNFIPTEYTLADTVRGDLNLDGISDLVMVLENIKKDSSVEFSDERTFRPILLLLGQKDYTYKLAVQNNDAIFCFDCGGVLGDPFRKITVKEGSFSIEHFGGASVKWARTSTFTYDKIQNKWFLTEDALVNGRGPDDIETKILNTKDFGNISFADFNINKE